MSRLWRVWLPDLPGDAGRRVELPAEEAHHVRRVLRLTAGDPIALFDGRGREWSARLEESSADGRLTARFVSEMLDPVEPGLRVHLYQALCRQDRFEWVIQKGTEIGVTAIHPLAAERAEGRPPDAKRLSRWRRIAIEACKQSGRRLCPEILPVDRVPPPGPAVAALALDPGSAELPLGRALLGGAPEELWLAVGPEGGFSDVERERMVEQGWRPVRLGPRILRTETAGLVACAIALHRLADLGPTRPRPGSVRGREV
jgi:16S rRNA (uracil1498-N3)-methyltransferase